MAGVGRDLFWVPNEEEVWTLASQASPELPSGVTQFLVLATQKLVSCQMSKCLPAVDAKLNPEDMVFLPDVNQATILACTKSRYLEKKIYTSIGLILMSVNPFENIPGLYGPKIMKVYRNSSSKTLDSHIYQVPSRAFSNMCSTGNNQSILISGESGSGKTEAAKECLAFLTAMADAQQISPLKSAANQSHAAAGIAERIISASPILEAFGNAQTLRNPNSSRFGKWMVLNFNSANRIIAAHIVSYLLEKSRVTKRDLCERNYHIFYQLLRGADEEMLQSCRLVRDTKSYHYLLGEANYLKDSECYAETHEAFLKMGFSEEDVKEVFKIIGAILIIGNIEFKPIRDGEAADFVSEKELETAAEMLSLKSTLLKYSLKNRSIESGKVRRSLITIQLNVQKATETRDTLARTLYDNLFHDIISGINKNSDSGAGEYVDRCIGLLDIFGFEIFVDNSFEQLCINYCNEMLQNHFNYVVFTSEKSLYAAESITCDTIEFKDNIETIKEIQAVFKSLDEEGRIPRGSSKAWYDKMKRNAKYSHISYPNKKDVFVVQHYAGDVAYEPLGFMEKNVETLSNDLVSTMLSSTDLTVKRIFSSSEPESPKSDSGKVAAHSSLSVKSISWKFQEQLQALTKMLNQTESHFIRCIKSNEPCRPFKFDSVLVHRQLLYSGVFEVVKIQQSGLPCRIKHHEFIDRYKCLVPSRLRYNLKSPNELIRQLRESKLDVSHVQVGNTMTFFKGLEQRLLDTKKEDLLDMSATRIQKWIRMKTRQGIYRSLIVYYRSFWQFNDNLILAPAEEQYALLRNVVESLHRIDRYDVLGKMLSNLEFELSVLEQRAHLLEQAETLLEERTESSILAMNVVLSRAIELALTTHTTIRKCKDYTQHFYRALEFITFVNSPEKINSLSLYNLTEGITDMETFGDIIPDAQAAKTLAEQHKNVVVHELHDIYEPLQEALEKASLVFDEDSGDLHLKYPDEDSSVRAGVSDSYYIKLKGLVEACGERTFHSFDLEELHLDCKHFLRLREDYLGVVDANGAIEFISNCVTHNSVFLDQMEQFKLWADIQRSPVALRAALMVGWVARTQIGGESEVEIEKLVEVVEKVGRLKNPSEQLIRVMRVGNWMIKLRQAYMTNNWEELELLVEEADEDANRNGTFEDYPECIEEIDNCQWQVIYHGLLADVLFVCQERVFSLLSPKSSSWLPLVQDLTDNVTLIETVRSFASSRCSPKLITLIPFLEKILQLRSLIYKRDFTNSKAVHNSFLEDFSGIISEFSLSETIEPELSMSGKLIRKLELEEALIIELSRPKAKQYSCDLINEQPLYKTGLNLTPSITLMENLLAEFEKLSEDFDADTCSKLNGARLILKGRRLLMREEDNVEIDWHIQREDMFSKCEDLKKEVAKVLASDSFNGKDPDECSDDESHAIKLRNQHILFESIDPIEPNTLSVDAEETERKERTRSISINKDAGDHDFYLTNFKKKSASEMIKIEFETIIHELIRREILANLRSILTRTCIIGSIDIDVHVNELELLQLFQQFNDTSLMMAKRIHQLPDNLKALHQFVRSILLLRKAVLHKEWEDIPYILDDIIHTPHGDGLNASGVKEELMKVKGECKARKVIENMKTSLQNLHVTFAGDKLSEKEINIDISKLKSSMAEIQQYQGKHSQELYKLGEKVIRILELLLANKMETLDDVESALQSYNAYGLDNSNMESVVEFVRIHNFFRNICRVLESVETSEELFLSVNQIKNSIKFIPQKFVPWLKAAFIYCELVHKLECSNWLAIVECAKRLEGQLSHLTEVKIIKHAPGSGGNADQGQRYETTFINLLGRRKAEGYRKALQMKSIEEENRRLEAIAREESNEEKLKHRLRDEDANNEYGIAELRKAGYDDEQILKLKYPARYLWALDFDPILLRTHGYKAKQLLSVGYTPTQLYNGGYSVETLRQASCSVKDLLTAGCTHDQLRIAGFDEEEIIQDQLDHTHNSILNQSVVSIASNSINIHNSQLLRSLDYDAGQLTKMGVSLQELITAGYSARELLIAGFNASQLRSNGMNDAKELRDAGFDLPRLKSAGFSIHELAYAGYDYESLCDAGFSYQYLYEAKFYCQLEREALSDLYAATKGDNWRLRLNWLSNKPLREWYGVKVKLDQVNNQERVFALDLQDNNLRGKLPEKLWLLGKIKYLRFSTNSLSGTIPAPVAKRIYCNNAAISISNNLQDFTLPPSSAVQQIILPEEIDLKSSGWMNSLLVQSPIRKDAAVAERGALMDLFNATGGNKWRKKKNWGSFLPISEWYGVHLNSSGRVTKLILNSNNLCGSVPSSLMDLEQLRELDLRQNQLIGSIPEQINRLTRLTKLYLQSNKLSGTIPAAISDLSQLTILDLRSNLLVIHQLPDNISKLRKLSFFAVYSNKVVELTNDDIKKILPWARIVT